MTSPARSIYGRVALAVVVAGGFALGLATIGIAWVVGDDQEAALVDSAIRRAELARTTIEHRVALARAELRAVAHTADAGRILEAPSLVSGSILALRCVRDDSVVLEATSSPDAEAMLTSAPPAARDAVSLAGDRRIVVRVRAASLDASALVDLSDLVAAAPGESVALSRAGAGEGGTLVARRFRDAEGEERVRVTAPVGDGLVLTSTTSLAPARRAALRAIQRVSGFSTLAFLPLLLLAWLGARAVTRPLRALAAAVRAARGDVLELPPLPRDEIGDLGAAIAAAARRNQELAQMAVSNERLLAAGRLAAGVAHEMNNPLAFVLANLQSVEPRLTGADKDAVSDARQGAERLVRIVRDLSSLSRGGSSLQLADVDLAELARFAARMAAGRRPGVTLEVDAPVSVAVRGDRGRLEQVLVNLVVNAIDATRDRPSPRVTVQVRRDGDRGVVQVTDNGSGVPVDSRAKLFAPFFTTKGADGTGLGLYLSRSFAQAHGGDLALESTSDAGSTFALRIPASAPADGPRAEPAAAAPPAAWRSVIRVLVVDDEGAIVRGLTRWIGKRAEVTGCCDPEEALDLATRGDYALILCDLAMPRMTGTAFVEALQRRHAQAASRVVIMTGGDTSAVPPPVRAVQKPLSPTLLEELLGAS